MEAVPLLPKTKVLPNLDSTPLIREIFQNEFQANITSKKQAENIIQNLEVLPNCDIWQELYKSERVMANFDVPEKKDNIVEYSKNVLQAHKNHSANLEGIKDAEKHLFNIHGDFLEREKFILSNASIRNLLSLKRQPLFKSLNRNYVRKYKLIQGDAGLPPKYELKSDFRVKNFKKWRRNLDCISQEDVIANFTKYVPRLHCQKFRVKKVERREKISTKKEVKWKIKKENGKSDSLKANPKIVLFTDYKLGDIYIAEVKIINIQREAVKVQLKPTNPDGPFRVMMIDKNTELLPPGMNFTLNIEFTPNSTDNSVEDLVIVTEDGNRLLIPLIAYLEPPILKTHKDIDEFTTSVSEKINSSYVECGACFTGDTKVTKVTFRCYNGSGEFFIMSGESWNRTYINTVTVDNILEVQPFRVYPVFFKMEKNQVIDLFVEFIPKDPGTHVEKIMIACDNGEVRSLDLIGDALGWHSYYFTFQDSILKELPMGEDDDVKVKYYLDFENTSAKGKVQKVFYVSNNSNLSFDFQWKIRDANIMSSEKYLRLGKDQVKIDPESGSFDPKSIYEFLVTITFNNAELGNYRMVLSLYVLNLPYQCIQEDDTIIQPTGLVRNLYSQSLYGEDESSALTPELASLQGTYESLQESIKSYVECQNKAQAVSKNDFCKSVCIPNPGLCAHPLKKSKTYVNIGESIDEVEGLVCSCQPKREIETNSETCTSNTREERATDLSPPRNEIIWDFVDILVDEVELWVEVSSARVTLEPSIIQINKSLNIMEHFLKEVSIKNHSNFPVTCRWLLSSKEKIGDTTSRSAVYLLLDRNSETSEGFKSSINSKHSNLKSDITGFVKSESNSADVTERYGDVEKPYDITLEPGKEFTVFGLTTFTCKILLVPHEPGKIQETLCLRINDGELELNLLILGETLEKHIYATPNLLDFGVLGQGSRHTKDFQIIKDNKPALPWRIKQFEFDFESEKFSCNSFNKSGALLKKSKGITEKNVTATTETFCLDARVPGMKCSILEIEESNDRKYTAGKQYVMVLGDVKLPSLSLSCPRFENAILAPPGKMYVGQKITMKVTLMNAGAVETFLTWGHPFGCHCRKVKVEITPKSCRIENKKKLIVTIDLTALEEGIISHCYVPCFFCRSLEPLILSIVGVAENLNVTFEIIDYPMQKFADPKTFLKTPFYHTVLRIPWPQKKYSPTLSLPYLNECDIMSMTCYCREVEEEAFRAFDKPEDSKCIEETQSVKKINKSFETDVESSLKSTNVSEESGSSKRSSKTSSLHIKISEENTLVSANSSESLIKPKFPLEFLNVPHRKPILRQFVIRNESPIETSFQINVATFGVSKNLPNRRLELIKNRVYGCSTDEFNMKLAKDQPLLILVEPANGELKPFDAVCINVHCYGNTWGEYRDELICQIKGIPTYHLKMLIQVLGHPIYFPMFKNQDMEKPTLRFQTVSFNQQEIAKEIKVGNRCAIPLSIIWFVFLTKPILRNTDWEEASAELPSYFDSIHSEENTESLKNYISKNTSKSGSVSPIFSERKAAKRNLVSFGSPIKSKSSTSPLMSKRSSYKEEFSLSQNTSFEQQLQMYPGQSDRHTFKIEPKEMFFEPLEEKKMTITFNPHYNKPEEFPTEFHAILTGCIKLKPEDEKCEDLYHRPSGQNFISELIDFNAIVEVPFVSLRIVKGDLRFTVDSNTILKSSSRSWTTSRKFLVQNKNQNTLSLKIEILPGLLFKVKSVNTIDKFYPEYDPDLEEVKVAPEHDLEMELQCSVSYRDLIYAFDNLKKRRKKSECLFETPEQKQFFGKKKTGKGKVEPWKQSLKDPSEVDSPKVRPRDSLELNLNRISHESMHGSFYPTNNYEEYEGEYTYGESVVCSPKGPKHVMVVEEEITISQPQLATQNLVAELHIHFPVLKISDKTLDFGNVYLGETATRYFSVLNQTGFPTDFRIMTRENTPEFAISPTTGSLRPCNYKMDIGETITVTFKPSQPGHFKEVYQIYGNLELLFDSYELFVSGFGTWNERYRSPKFETHTKLEGIYYYLKDKK